MSLLRGLPSIKLKIGILILAAIAVTMGTMVAGHALEVPQLVTALAALALALAVVFVLARGTTTAPLREMERAAAAMARGEHGQRVTVRSSDEVGRLGAAFNAMAAELETLDVARRNLLADAAHELRTPITALRASLENAIDGVSPADLPALHAQTRRLGHLADQLLDLSALEAGASRIEAHPFPARELVDGCSSTHLDIPPELTVRGDRVRLRQLVSGLVENARTHAPGATVTVRVRPEATGIRLEVEDDGPGIPVDDVARVFDRFSRSDRSRHTPGSGLGLAIARSIVEHHGGTITVEPVSPHGCRMVITLP